MEVLKLHLTGLLRFSGRETGAKFWPWVAVVLVFNMAVAAIVMVPLMLNTFRKMNQFVHEHPDQGTIVTGPGSYSVQVHGYHPELMPDLSGFMLAIQVSAAVSVLMLAAAVTRRLHDTDKSGLFGLLPLPFLTTGLTLFPAFFAQSMSGAEPDTGGFMLLFANNMLYLGLLGLLAFLLARKSSSGDNRFGPPVD